MFGPDGRTNAPDFRVGAGSFNTSGSVAVFVPKTVAPRRLKFSPPWTVQTEARADAKTTLATKARTPALKSIKEYTLTPIITCRTASTSKSLDKPGVERSGDGFTFCLPLLYQNSMLGWVKLALPPALFPAGEAPKNVWKQPHPASTSPAREHRRLRLLCRMFLPAKSRSPRDEFDTHSYELLIKNVNAEFKNFLG